MDFKCSFLYVHHVQNHLSNYKPRMNTIIKRTLFLTILLPQILWAGDGNKTPADYVNPFIGASSSSAAAGIYHGLGKTFPGATTPFGMVQVSPQTITGLDNGSGYSYEHKTIEGFALTQMSGVGWYGELGNFLIMPTTGKLQTVAGKEDGSVKGYRSTFNKNTEIAQAGYYSCDLTDYGIRVETSATAHCGILRFTYPKNKESRIQVDLARRVAGSSDYQHIEILDDHTFRGWMMCTPLGGGWGNGGGKVRYTLHFYGYSTKPLKNAGFYSADIPDGQARKNDDVVTPEYLQRVSEAVIVKGAKSMDGKHIGFFNDFSTKAGEQVELKVGISFVDAQGAYANYMAEMDGKSFDDVRAEARDVWNGELGKIAVEGGTEEEKTVFYTSMYHSFIDPRICADVDGRYIGGDYLPHYSGGAFTKRTVFSGWDVFRSQFPLMTIVNPRLVSDMINSLVTLAEQSKRFYFARWELLNSYSGCMFGNPALSVVADAYMKGIRTFDVEKAYEYCKNSSYMTGNGPRGYTSGDFGISCTLEYAYFDWCVSQLATALGKPEEAALYRQKGQAYRNTFREDVNWFCPRNEDGSWLEWPKEGRLKDGFGSTESNPYQQGWFVPHDIDGMVELMGGRDAVLADLADFFEKTPEDMMWNSYYNHANEPVHLVPFIFNRLDTPWNTQKWTRYICRNAYRNKVEGLVGNEDAGQMSAWYILASCGIHPACPGETRLEITSPVFSKVTFRLDPDYAAGESFSVVAHDNSAENVYIQRALLNGEEYDKCWIDYGDIAAGGTLELFMGPAPNKSWGLDN